MAYKFNPRKDRDIFNTGFFEGWRVATSRTPEPHWTPLHVPNPTLETNLEYLKNDHQQRDFAEAAILGFEAGMAAVKDLKKDQPAPPLPDLGIEWLKAIGQLSGPEEEGSPPEEEAPAKPAGKK